MFKPIHNPFIVGNPIRGKKMFFGREDDFAYIHTKITGDKDGGLIVLCGARRSGKTSILFQIQEGRLGEGFVPVLIDMQSMAIKNDRDFLEKAARTMITSGSSTESQVESFGTEFESNPYEAFEAFVKRIAEKLGDRKLVLAFDEYELFETHIDNGVLDPQVLRLFGNLIEHKKLFVLFTGSDRLEARKKKYWEFLTKGLNRKISYLTRRDTLRLVMEPVDGIVEYEPSVPEAIADLTAGQPFYTQVLCQSIVDHLNEKHKYDVTPDDLQEAVDEVVADPLPQMIFHWNQLPTLEKLCLSIIAELNKTESRPVGVEEIAGFMARERIGYRADSGALKKSLENLFKGDLLSKSADADTYVFRMGLWHAWISRMHSVWRVIDQMERGGEIPDELERVKKSTVRTWMFRAAALVVVLAAVYVMRGPIFGVGGDGDAGLSTAPVEYAHLDIRSEPTDAEVWVDGARLGWTPLNDSVPAGAHLFELMRAGYRTQTDSTNLAAGAVWDTSFVLDAITGGVRVESTPAGARILLDGEETGRVTPAELGPLPIAESHTVAIALEGFNRYTFPSVNARADTTIVISRDLSRRTAPLRISSEPSGAAFDLGDGRWTGVTPFAITGVAHGTHALRLTADGYEPWQRDVTVPYPDNELFATLNRLADGYVRVMIQPVGDVYIDGTRVRTEISYGIVPARPGARIVEIRFGDRSHRQTIDLVPGDTVTVRQTFAPQ